MPLKIHIAPRQVQYLVVIERMDLLYQQLGIAHASSRPVVIGGITFGGRLTYTGSGPLFVEDVCAGTVRVGREQQVWARQLNCEAQDQTKTVNDGGTLGIQSIKTERAQLSERASIRSYN
jgi:hypothetical protein